MTRSKIKLLDFFLNASYKRAVVTLFVILSLQALFYKYWPTFKQPGVSMHAWRQADCLSFAYCFYDGSGTFLEPAVNNIGGSARGKCASDFPLIQYLVGKIWHITGVTPIVFRLITLILTFLGLFHVFKLLNLLFKENYLLSICLTTFLFTSPILSYYGVSVISDMHALSMSFVGLFYWFRWLKNKTKFDLFWVIVAFSLAGLFKLSAGLSYFVCLFIGLLQFIKTSEGFFLKQIRMKYLLTPIILVLPIVFWFLWYHHADAYNDEHPTDFFLIGIRPFWDASVTHVMLIETLRRIIYYTLPETIMSVSFYSLTILVTLVVTITQYKKYKHELWVIYSCIFFYFLFIALFFQVLPTHDYYFTNLTALFLIALVFILQIIHQSQYHRIFKSRIFTVTALIVLGFFSYKAAMFTRGKYKLDITETSLKTVMFNIEEAGVLSMSEYNDDLSYRVIGHKMFSAEKIGIKKENIVLCLGDNTINRSLFLMQRKGYTSYNLGGYENTGSFLRSPENDNINYIVLLDKEILKDSTLIPYLNNKVFDQNGTTIYKVDLKKKL
jgi:hypothetical protein